MTVVVEETTAATVTVEGETVSVVVAGVGVRGPAGPAGPTGATGPQGPQGPQGPSGGTANGNYTHTQSVPAATWTIPHNLNFRPAGIVVIDSSDRQVDGFEISYPDANTAVLGFTAGFSGIAYLS